jgi:hypothetical protein
MRRVVGIAAGVLTAVIVFAGSGSGSLLWPLPSSGTLTGGFADTRPDHFHGGVDLRAQTPQPVIAPTDGWVERLSVNPSGYGHTLYFRLDDGRTAVFGHLSRFAPLVEEALRDSQLVTGTARIEIVYPVPRVELTFTRGDTIAYTGKTGTGPAHLHFEIREGTVQTDPLSNFEPQDHAKPVITGLWWTTLSGYSPVASGFRLNAPQRGNQWLTHQRHGIDTNEPVAFFIQAYDPGPWGRNAVPAAIRIRVNGELVHEIFPGRIDLVGPKQFYGDIIWAQRRRNRRDIRRLFLPPPPAQYAFTPIASDGWLSDLSNATVTIEVVDRAGNTATAEVPVTCGPAHNAPVPPPCALTSGAFTLFGDIPSLAWAKLSPRSPSEIFISPAEMGFARPCTLAYHYAPANRAGLYFYERTSASSWKPLWSIAELENGETMSCTILHGGTYGVALDTIPPQIQLSAFGGRIRLRAFDVGSWIDDGTLRCTVDSLTAIPEFEYDARGGFIWTRTPLARGRHDVQVTAGDRAGNVQTYRSILRIR